MKILTINLIKIENPFLFKLKDLLKNKNGKHIINFEDVADFSVDKYDATYKKMLIGSLLIKKINKLISKHSNKDLTIYYVIDNVNDNVINNIYNNTHKYYNGEIVFKLYTDLINVKLERTIEKYKLLELKND